MAAKLGSIVVDIKLKTGKYVKGISKSKKATKGFKQSLGGLKTALISLAGASGLGLIIKKSTDAADAIGKNAVAVGLTAEAYQEFAHAADLAGTTQSAFTSNMTAFVKRIGDARKGFGPLITSLKQFDQELLSNLQNTKNQEEAFNILADAVKDAGSAADRASLANAAFGRSGVHMVTVLKQGSEGLAKQRKEARDLGIILSNTAIAGAEKLKDEMTKFERVLTTKVTKSVIENAAEIQLLVTGLIDLVGWVGKAAVGYASLFDNSKSAKTKEEINQITEKMNSLRKAISRAADARISTSSDGWIDQLNNFIAGRTAETATDRLNELNNELLELQKRREKLIEGVTESVAPKSGSTGSSGVDNPDSNQNKAAREKLKTDAKAKLESLTDSLRDETQVINDAYATRSAIVGEALLQGVTNEDNANALILQLALDHEAEKTRIAQEGVNLRNAVAQQQLANTSSIFRQATQLTSREGKKQSTLNKILAKGSIIADTAAAAMKGYNTAPFFPVGLAMGTLALALGAKQLSKVGGGGGGGGGASIPSPTPIDITTPESVTSGAQQPTSATQVIFTGDMLGEDLSERLVSIIQEATNDRDIVVFNSDSRQAQEIIGAT